jgi:membrane protein
MIQKRKGALSRIKMEEPEEKEAMATGAEQHRTTGVRWAAKESAKTLRDFFTKFNNDWVMGFASALAFNLITAILPILVAMIAIVGFTVGRLDPAVEHQLLSHLQSIFPASNTFLNFAFASLKRSAGLLGIIAVALGLFGGSRLFVSMEGYFDVIYHTRSRTVMAQNMMAFAMMLLFIVLAVPMMLASSLPALLQVLLEQTIVGRLPGNGFLFGLLGILVSLCLSWILFVAIYIVVPNQSIRFRKSWPGAVVAAVLLQMYLALFPLYITHFLKSYIGTPGLMVVLLFFLYYFAVILLLGAEINAFFAEHIRVTPDNVAGMIHQLTGQVPPTEKERPEQAPPSHQRKGPEERHPLREAS